MSIKISSVESKAVVTQTPRTRTIETPPERPIVRERPSAEIVPTERAPLARSTYAVAASAGGSSTAISARTAYGSVDRLA